MIGQDYLKIQTFYAPDSGASGGASTDPRRTDPVTQTFSDNRVEVGGTQEYLGGAALEAFNRARSASRLGTADEVWEDRRPEEPLHRQESRL